MPACEYELYLFVFNSISHSFAMLTRYRVKHSKIKFVSTRGHLGNPLFLQIMLFTKSEYMITQAIAFASSILATKNGLNFMTQVSYESPS